MKRVLALAALLACGTAAPAMADQGHVPFNTLSRLGLAGMQSMSDSEGLTVRGMGGGGGIVAAMGKSLVSGAIISPNTKNFVAGTTSNMAMGNAEHAGGHFDHHGHKGHGDKGFDPALFIQTNQNSILGLQLIVAQDLDVFSGVLIGGAGGTASASLK